jgi:hypothetical protein
VTLSTFRNADLAQFRTGFSVSPEGGPDSVQIVGVTSAGSLSSLLLSEPGQNIFRTTDAGGSTSGFLRSFAGGASLNYSAGGVTLSSITTGASGNALLGNTVINGSLTSGALILNGSGIASAGLIQGVRPVSLPLTPSISASSMVPFRRRLRLITSPSTAQVRNQMLLAQKRLPLAHSTTWADNKASGSALTMPFSGCGDWSQ